MKIVVLDGYALNPGDLSWDELSVLGDLAVYERTSREQILERAKDAVCVLTNKTVLDAETLSALPALRYIGVLATGYNVVDTAAASARGIVVTNIPAYSTASVAQMVFAHLLTIVQRVEYYTEQARNGIWSSKPDFCYWDTPLWELCGKQMGIVGLGNIGQAVARIALSMGMTVAAVTSKQPQELMEGIRKVNLEELLRTSDVVTLHCPLNAETRELINKETLEWMKPTAVLINTGRGGLVNGDDLAEALNRGQIYAAGIDVMPEEPPVASHPLLQAKNCFITPHVAWATKEARIRLMKQAVDNLKAFLNHQPINVV